mgnify:FL=1
MEEATHQATTDGFSVSEEGVRHAFLFMDALISKMAERILEKKKCRAVIEYDPEGRATVKFEEAV